MRDRYLRRYRIQHGNESPEYFCILGHGYHGEVVDNLGGRLGERKHGPKKLGRESKDRLVDAEIDEVGRLNYDVCFARV
jgi:hypothetical protein